MLVVDSRLGGPLDIGYPCGAVWCETVPDNSKTLYCWPCLFNVAEGLTHTHTHTQGGRTHTHTHHACLVNRSTLSLSVNRVLTS